MARQASKKASIHKPGYRAVVVGEGLLLGGVKTHKSSWFKTKQEALDWTWAIRRGNAEAGRRIARVTIEHRKSDGSLEIHPITEDAEGAARHHSTKKTPTEIRYVFRGSVERGTGRGYKWHDGYSEDSPGGGITYPWLTKREAQADAKVRGARAVFVAPSNLAGPTTKGHHATKKKSPAQLERDIAEVIGSRPINRRKSVRHFSEWKDKVGRTHLAVTYEDLSGHSITPQELLRYREREARGDVQRRRY